MQLQHKGISGKKEKKYNVSSFYLIFQLGSCGPGHSEIKPEVAAVTPALHSEEQATSMPDPPRAFPPYLRVQIPACSFKSSWVCTLHFFFSFFNFYFEICWTRTGKFPKWRTSGSPNAVEQLLLGRETPFSSGYVKLCKSMKRSLKPGFKTFGLKLIFNAFLTCSTCLY